MGYVCGRNNVQILLKMDKSAPKCFSMRHWPRHPPWSKMGFWIWKLSGSETLAWGEVGKIWKGMSHGFSNLPSSMWSPLGLDNCEVNELEWRHPSSLLRAFLQSPGRLPPWPWSTLCCLPSDLVCPLWTKIREEMARIPCQIRPGNGEMAKQSPKASCWCLSPSQHYLNKH